VAPDTVSVTLHDTSNAAHLAAVFRQWAGPDADYRMVFTPDVLIAVTDNTRRGNLFDDGWTVECWIERGVPEFLQLLRAEFPNDDCLQIDHPQDPAPGSGLTAWAMDRGQPIAAVRHRNR
jgi:hypothetical protein